MNRSTRKQCKKKKILNYQRVRIPFLYLRYFMCFFFLYIILFSAMYRCCSVPRLVMRSSPLSEKTRNKVEERSPFRNTVFILFCFLLLCVFQKHVEKKNGKSTHHLNQQREQHAANTSLRCSNITVAMMLVWRGARRASHVNEIEIK